MPMHHYLISFPSSAMRHLSAEALAKAGVLSRAVIRDAKAAGVYVFAGGLDEAVAPVMISGDAGAVAGTYPETPRLNGGFCVLKLPSRQAAEAWAARLASACGCAQELRPFMFDPES